MLSEGDVIELKAGHRVCADVPRHFVYANQKGMFGLTHSVVTIGGELGYLAGRYVVYKTSMDGGGSNGPGDDFPNGHHVYCESVDGKGRHVDFYQSGCSTAMIKDIRPVGRATLQWSIG